MSRMRTIKTAIDYFRKIDPETAISENFIRTEARTGRLPGVVMAGSRYLVDLDKFEEYLATGVTIKQKQKEQESNVSKYGKLRRIQR